MAELPIVQHVITSLRNCRTKKDLGQARCVHVHICYHGLEVYAPLGNVLLEVFVECGSLLDAQQVFDRLNDQGEISWTSLIQGYAACRKPECALRMFKLMQERGIEDDRFTYLALFRACIMIKCLETGRELHAIVVNKAFDRYSFVGNTLVDLYAKCGSMIEARSLFNKMSTRSTVSWNVLMTGYVEHKLCDEALSCFEQMQSEGVAQDAVTFVCGLKACGRIGAIDVGHQIHSKLVSEGFDQDQFVSSMLVDMHVKCGSLSEACYVLDAQPDRDVVSWTALVKGYADHGYGEEALDCMREMQLDGAFPNAVTLVSGLKACSVIGDLNTGRRLHIEITLKEFESDPFLGSGLIDMYAKCGCFVDAYELFRKLPTRTAVSWSALIAGYAERGRGVEALMQLEEMQREGMALDAITISSSLRACGGIRDSLKGQELHIAIAIEGFEHDSIVISALVYMYAKCGLLDEAVEAFEELPSRDVASWTSLVAGYADHDLGEKAVNCYEEMQLQGVSPDVVTFVCGVKACASVGALDSGKKTHSEIVKRGLESDSLIANSMVDLFAKCGLLKEAHDICIKLPGQSVISWTTLIAGYAYQGEIEHAFLMFEKMSKQGVRPNEMTFLAVLTVCSHAGAVERGLVSLQAMDKHYGLLPTLRHYNCVVDLFSRAGQLNEAFMIVEDMPSQPNLVTWKTLIGACRKSGDIGLARQAFDCALRTEVKHDVLYILMYIIYVEAQLWAEAQEVEAMRNDIKAWKEPENACSFGLGAS